MACKAFEVIDSQAVSHDRENPVAGRSDGTLAQTEYIARHPDVKQSDGRD
jgi:hypothetical protein